MNSPKRPISDELLRLMIEAKIEAGVNSVHIRELIEGFASYYDRRPSQAPEIVGFLAVEDIPGDRRGAFLTALLALTEEPNHRRDLRRKVASQAHPGMTFPVALLGKAVAFLRLRA